MAYALFIDQGVCHTPLLKPGHPTSTCLQTRAGAQPASTARSLYYQGRGTPPTLSDDPSAALRSPRIRIGVCHTPLRQYTDRRNQIDPHPHWRLPYALFIDLKKPWKRI